MGLHFSEMYGGRHSAPEAEADEHAADDSATPRPTFTPATRETEMREIDTREADDDTVQDDALTGTVVEPTGNYPQLNDVDEPVEAPAAVEADEPAVSHPDAETDEADEGAPPNETLAAHEAEAAAAAEPVTATPFGASPPPASVAPAGLDQPALIDDPELLARWQLVQLGFIDDPRAAVAGAADILEEAGRALVEALQERQRQMRALWDHGSAGGPAAPEDTNANTEQLRQVMRRYQVLFNQFRQPV